MRFFSMGPMLHGESGPPEPLAWGRPIRNEKQRLVEALYHLLGLQESRVAPRENR